jgi:hypothetical protein
VLLAGGVACADPAGQSASTFVPRADAAPTPVAKTPITSLLTDTVPKAGLAPPVVPVQAKSDVPAGKNGSFPVSPRQDPYEAYIRLEPPGRERLFANCDTERELEERMRQERRDTGTPGDPIVFPDRPETYNVAFQPRKYEPMTCQVEPSYIVYPRLYFEEKNTERYGWEKGPFQPLISTLYFFKDVALLPHNIATYPCRRFETNAGQCLPGDPVPYYLYPPELTGSGLLAEVGTIALISAIIPP